jgi:hypothetical protein
MFSRSIGSHDPLGIRTGAESWHQEGRAGSARLLARLSAEVKKVAPTMGIDAAMKKIKLPKYEKWSNYEQYLPGNHRASLLLVDPPLSRKLHAFSAVRRNDCRLRFDESLRRCYRPTGHSTRSASPNGWVMDAGNS